MSKKLDVISKADLEKRHTGTLMTRRSALLKCEESFKNTSQWKQAYEDLKVVLSTRENIPNKQERKALRQAKAKQPR